MIPPSIVFRFKGRPTLATLLALLLGAGLSADPLRADEALWRALAGGGHVAVMRHALAPGIGDPPNFVVEDCATQRNLSEAGRAQARAIGARFRRAGVGTARVLSSQWCRCLETARLLDLGPVEPAPMLNSFFTDARRARQQTEEVRAFLAGLPRDGKAVILVTHQVNMREITGSNPRSGEFDVLRLDPGGGTTLIGSIEP